MEMKNSLILYLAVVAIFYVITGPVYGRPSPPILLGIVGFTLILCGILLLLDKLPFLSPYFKLGWQRILFGVLLIVGGIFC